MIHCVLKTQCLGKQRLGLSSACVKDNPGFSSLKVRFYVHNIFVYTDTHTRGSYFALKRIFVTHKCVSMYISYVSFVFFLFFCLKKSYQNNHQTLVHVTKNELKIDYITH